MNALFVAYFSLIEHIFKVLLGITLLVLNLREFKDKDVPKLEELFPDLYAIIGFVGIYYAVGLIRSVKKQHIKGILPWIVFQWISIINQVYVYFILLKMAKASENYKQYEVILFVIAASFTIAEVCFLHSIIYLRAKLILQDLIDRSNSIGNNEETPFGSDHSSHSASPNDKPPTYEECVQP